MGVGGVAVVEAGAVAEIVCVWEVGRGGVNEMEEKKERRTTGQENNPRHSAKPSTVSIGPT